MTEYFIRANSCAAPFFSDSSTAYIRAGSPRKALNKFAAKYDHPCGLYAAACYKSADAMYKGEKALARWLSKKAKQVKR